MSRQLPDIRPPDVMEMALLVQYFDMMRDVGGHSGSSVIFVPHSPGGMADLGNKSAKPFLPPLPWARKRRGDQKQACQEMRSRDL